MLQDIVLFFFFFSSGLFYSSHLLFWGHLSCPLLVVQSRFCPGLALPWTSNPGVWKQGFCRNDVFKQHGRGEIKQEVDWDLEALLLW